MLRPRIFIKLLLAMAVILYVSSGAFAVARPAAYAPQQNSKQLYETANSHYAAGEYQEALDALETLLKTDSTYAPALLLKYKSLVRLFAAAPPLLPEDRESHDARLQRKVRLAKLLKEAADSLEKFLQLQPDVADADYLRAQLSALRVYSEPAVKPESEWTVFSSGDVTEKAHILRKREPAYPEEARQARVSGRVKLLAVLADDGTVKDILVLQSPNRWLSESSIEAARRISFQPAMKDGRPVSTSILLMYNFNTY